MMFFAVLNLVACGQKEGEQSAPQYPKLSVEKAKGELETFMWLKGYQEELPVQKQVKKDETKDGRPALIFTMTSEDGKNEGTFIVSIDKNDFENYTSDILKRNY